MSDVARYVCLAVAAVAVICASVVLGASVGRSFARPHGHSWASLPAKIRKARRRPARSNPPLIGPNATNVPVPHHGCSHIYCEPQRVRDDRQLPGPYELATAVGAHDAVALGFRAPPALIPQTLRPVPLRVEYTAASRPLPFEPDTRIGVEALEWEFEETHSFVDKQ